MPLRRSRANAIAVPAAPAVRWIASTHFRECAKSRTRPDQFLSMTGRVVVVICMFLLATASASAQAISGKVLDVATERPIAGALVSALRGKVPLAVALSDSLGAFVLRFPRSGGVQVGVERIGYASFVSDSLELPREEILHVEVRLIPQPIVLPEITAVATEGRNWRRDQFLDRQRTGFGRYLGPKELEEKPIISTVQAILRIGGGRFLLDDRATGIIARRIPDRGPQYCVPRIYIDGTQAVQSALGTMDRRPRGIVIDDFVNPSLIRGVEVYPNTMEAPPQFQSILGGDCPIIAIWTVYSFGR
jgi:hypothetical protein